MRRLQIISALALLLAVTALEAAPASAKYRQGPAGEAFYTPPAKLPGKKHGDLIWARKLTNPAKLSQARANTLVLYRSTGSDGKSIAVSGTVAVPKGKVPKKGWPVITWAHGTTGIADVCAPSRDDGSNPLHAYSAYAFPLMERWLKAGYAVVRTDYQGLGTPGTHEYLIGVPEGRSTLDIVRAARRLDPRISKQVAVAGHSQGGHAALFAGALAPRWTPDLKVRGTVAFAPASLLDDQVPAVKSISSPGGGLSSEIALIVRGLDTAAPGKNFPALFTDQAAALYPQTTEKCQPQLSQDDSWGALAPKDIFREDADLSNALTALDANDPEHLKFKAPVQIEQGAADGTVFAPVTEQLVKRLKDGGSKVKYATYEGVNHSGVVDAAAAHSTKFLRARFGR